MNSLIISNVQIASKEEWDVHWKNCKYATYFHSRTWNEVWQVYTERKTKAEAYLVQFSDGKNAIIPHVYKSKYRGLYKRLLMSPAGTFGGWISKDNLEKAHVILLYDFLKRKNIIWRVSPYSPYSEVINTVGGKKDKTNVLPLHDDFESIFRTWTKGHKSAAKKAKREGVSIQLAESIEDWKNYYKIYQKSLERWGEKATSEYTWKLFAELYKTKSNNIKLWLAFFNKDLAAGALCFYASKHVVYWHGAANEEYFNLRPVHYLLQEVIEDACNKNYQWFDFNPSGGHKGVRKFKRGFATVEKESPILFQSNHIGKNVNRIKWVITRIKEKLHVNKN